MAPGLLSAFGILIADTAKKARQKIFPLQANWNQSAPLIGPFAWPDFRNFLRLNSPVNIFRLNADDTDRQPETGWNNQQITQIGSLFSAAVTDASKTKQKELFSRRRSPHGTAVGLLDEFLIRAAKILPRLNIICDEAFEQHDVGVPSLLRTYGSVNEFPDSWDHCQLRSAFPDIALNIFGNDGFVDPKDPHNDRMKPDVQDFLNSIMPTQYQRLKGKFTRERKRRDKSRQLMSETYNDMMMQNTITESDLAKILRVGANNLRVFNGSSGHRDDKEFGEDWRSRMQDFREILALRDDGKRAARYPENLRNALRLLAMRLAKKEVKRSILEMMSNLEFTLGEDPEEDDGVTFASTLANSFNDEDAPTGTESYEALSDSDLCTHYLGLTSMDDVPGLNKTTPKSVTDMHLDPWQDETKSFFADDKNLEALRLDRLQWDAVAAAVTNAFKGSPLYITDEVGTGKTYSALAFVNLTIRWRIYHTQMNKFAARLYAHMSWPTHPNVHTDVGWMPNLPTLSEPGGVPDCPALVVCPTPLVDQWYTESHKLFANDHMMVLPYTSMMDVSKETFWMETAPKCAQSVGGWGNVLIIASADVVRRDFKLVWNKRSRSYGWDLLKTRNVENPHAKSSIYGRRYSVVIFDELHAARKTTSVVNHAYAILARTNPIVIGMTATPVVTEPDDLIAVGQLLNIPQFCDPSDHLQFKEMRKQLNATRKADRNDADPFAEQVLHRVATEDELFEDASHGQVLMMEQARKLRARFGECVIRRTPKRPKGPLSPEDERRYPPFAMEEVLLAVPSEIEARIIKELSEKELSSGRPAKRSDSNFYKEIRQALTHHLGARLPEDFPRTQQDWESSPSTKVDLIVQIVRRYMDRNRAVREIVPLDFDETKTPPPLPPRPIYTLLSNELQEKEVEHPPVRSKAPALDRIVVYSHWIPMSGLISRVLALAGFEAVEYNGKMKPAHRKELIQRFLSKDLETEGRNSGPGKTRVLIVTDIGTTGLNLQFATVLIIVDMLWSAQDDRQLIGRLERRGQMATAHIYRLVLLGTPDIWLNNISTMKAKIFQAFLGDQETLKRLNKKLHGTLDDDESDYSSDEEKTRRVRLQKTKLSRGRTRASGSLRALASRVSGTSKTSSVTDLDTDDVSSSIPSSEQPSRQSSRHGSRQPSRQGSRQTSSQPSHNPSRMDILQASSVQPDEEAQIVELGASLRPSVEDYSRSTPEHQELSDRAKGKRKEAGVYGPSTVAKKTRDFHGKVSVSAPGNPPQTVNSPSMFMMERLAVDQHRDKGQELALTDDYTSELERLDHASDEASENDSPPPTPHESEPPSLGLHTARTATAGSSPLTLAADANEEANHMVRKSRHMNASAHHDRRLTQSVDYANAVSTRSATKPAAHAALVGVALQATAKRISNGAEPLPRPAKKVRSSCQQTRPAAPLSPIVKKRKRDTKNARPDFADFGGLSAPFSSSLAKKPKRDHRKHLVNSASYPAPHSAADVLAAMHSADAEAATPVGGARLLRTEL